MARIVCVLWGIVLYYLFCSICIVLYYLFCLYCCTWAMSARIICYLSSHNSIVVLLELYLIVLFTLYYLYCLCLLILFYLYCLSYCYYCIVLLALLVLFVCVIMVDCSLWICSFVEFVGIYSIVTLPTTRNVLNLQFNQ